MVGENDCCLTEQEDSQAEVDGAPASVQDVKSVSAIRAVLFDLDGTLADSEVWWAQIDLAFLGEHGVVYGGEHHHSLVGVAAPDAMRFFKEAFRLVPSPEDLLRRYHEIAEVFYATRIEPFPEAAVALEAVREAGLKVGLVTSSDRRLVLPFLERHGLAPKFDVIVSGEQVARAKPAPEIYLLAARRLGLPPDHCLAVEDSLSGVRAGRAAGMTVIAIPDERWSDRAHFQGEAHSLAHSLSDVVTFLRGARI